MSSSIQKYLADAGYIETTRNKKLQNVYLLPEVKIITNRYEP
ncbi:BrxA family protein [Cognaticolwellia beringensis]